MLGVPGEEIERVRQYRERGAQGVDRRGGAAGNVEDEGRCERAAEATAEDGQGGLPAPFSAHEFGNAVQEAVADGAGDFGGHIAGTDAGSSGSYDEAGEGGCTAQCVFDGLSLVWNREGEDCPKAGIGQFALDSWTGAVFPKPLAAGIADGNDGGKRCRAGLFGHVFDCTNWGRIIRLMRK